jgi:hypothetical protein
MLNFLQAKFAAAQQEGLTKAQLARRIGKTPDVVNRWLGSPSNLTTDTLCDLLIGMSGEELYPDARPLIYAPPKNYSHAVALASDVANGESQKAPLVGGSSKTARMATPDCPLSAARAALATTGQSSRTSALSRGKRQ